MTNTTLKNLFLDISEEEYRKLPHISYSKISKFITKGPKSLLEPISKKKTQAMTLGSCFDTYLTDNEHILDKFFIGKEVLNDKQISIILDYFSLIEDNEEKNKELLLLLFQKYDFNNNLKDETKLKKFYSSEDVINYINALKINNDLLYITESEYEFIKYKVNLLKTHPFTKNLFNTNNEILYQVKVSSNNLGIKCMFDILIIDHENKIIYPIDLKFMSSTSKEFLRSFEKFNYYIQSSLYSNLLQYKLEKNEIPYRIEDFMFLIINQEDDIILKYIFKTEYDNETQSIIINNKTRKNWKYYVDLINWHLTNQVFDYSKEDYENQGLIIIPSTNNNSDNLNITTYDTTTLPEGDFPY